MYDKLGVEVLGYDYESLNKSNFITPKLMNFLTIYIDINDKLKLKKGLYIAQLNVLSTPDDDYFEYDLLKIDNDDSAKIDKHKDKYVLLMIYYKYKWAIALYDLVNK